MVGGYLLDTCVVSETGKPRPDANVEHWLRHLPAHRIWTSVLVLGELQHGIALLEESPRRRALVAWLGRQRACFGERCLGIDEAGARAWGDLYAARQRQGRPLPVIDGLLAATAIVRGLALVTRNVTDFADCGLNLVNPWAGTEQTPADLLNPP